MSGLYFLGVIALWLWLTWLLGKGLRTWWQKEETNRSLRAGVAIAIGCLWLGTSFWYAGGRKFYYDTQVNRLCAKDGGIRVYERVKLPAEKFDQRGMVKFYDPTKGEDSLGPEYRFVRETQFLQRGNPEVWRTHYKIIRRSDGRLLGESVSYSRRGGDLPGPWHPSSFGCPREAGKEPLIMKVFLATGGTER